MGTKVRHYVRNKKIITHTKKFQDKAVQTERRNEKFIIIDNFNMEEFNKVFFRS